MQIAQGAEAVILKDGNKIVKERLKKTYRVKEIDNSLRKFRTKREAKVIKTLKDHNIPCPDLLDMNDKNMTITMSFVDGDKLRDVFDLGYEKYSKELGKLIADLHNLDIIHGDLTTSNMIFNDRIYLIDFGLSFFSHKVEDKAVDLHLLRQAIESKHFKVFDKAFSIVLEEYKQHCKNSEEVLKRLEKVESRGRNKSKGC